MTTIQIFDPALCCSSGVCGTDVDQNLVNFSADADWARQQQQRLGEQHAMLQARFDAGESVDALLHARTRQVDATVRASLGLYSNQADIDSLVDGLKKAKELLS